MEKVVLYTCESGLSLLKRGQMFGAWNANHESHTDSDIKITVEKSSTEPLRENNAYKITVTPTIEFA
jgi:hypothetical protein